MNKLSSLKSRKGLLVFLSVVLLLVVLRVALPYILKSYLNEKLSNLGEYKGSLNDISLSLWRGAYQVNGLSILKAGTENKPFVSIKNSDISLSWMALVQGKLLSEIYLVDAQLYFLEGKNKQENQLKVKKESQKYWLESFQALVPLSVQSLQLENVNLKFENSKLKGLEQNNLLITQAHAKNLIVYEGDKNKLSPIRVDGILNKHAKLEISGGINLNKDPNFYDIDLSLKKFELKSANKLFKHYVPLDISKGSLTLLGEFKGNSQLANGYLRIFMYNLEILANDQKYKSGQHFLYEWVFGFGNWLLDTLKSDNVATEIPFEIKKGEFSLDSSEAFWNSLGNVVDEMPEEFKGI